MRVAMESFKSTAKVDLIHIPYQGGAPATMAALGGHATMLIVNVSEASPHILAGKLRALAVTSVARSELLKNVPTIGDSGFPGFDMSIWFGSWVAATTPREAVNRLSAEITRALKLPEVRAAFAKVGFETAALPADRFDPSFRQEVQRYGKIVREANIKAE